MTRWDEKEEQQSKGISGLVFFAIMIFAIGFFIGVLWGLSWADAAQTVIPPVFGESVTIYTSNLTTTHHITLYDGISIGDNVVTSP